MKLRIFHKGLILVCIPLFFELGVFCTLINLVNQEETALQQAARERQINNEINGIIRNVAAMGNVSHGMSFRGLPATVLKKNEPHIPDYLNSIEITEGKANFAQAEKSMFAHIEKLKALVRDDPDPKRMVVVQDSERAALKAKTDLHAVQQELIESGLENARDVLYRRRKVLDEDVSQLVTPGLLDMANEASSQVKEEKALELRTSTRQGLFSAVFFSLLLAISIGLVFYRDIASRLARLQLNTILLSSGKPLLPRSKGSDEIAQLDDSFHHAAELLAESEDRLQQTFDNASDLICSLEESLKIGLINKACEEFLGTSEQDLVGNRITSLIVESDRPQLLEALETCRKTPDKAIKAEVRMLTHEQGLVDTIVIPKWVESEKAFFCVFHDISDRKKAEQIRQEVFTMISHDMRAPISSFSSFLEMLRFGNLGSVNQQGERFLGYAEKSVERMTNLVEDIITLEKIKTGAIKPTIEAVNTREMLETLVSAMQVFADKNKVKININIKAANQTFFSDASLVEKILSNFLSNALRYSPAGSTITLSYEQNGEWGTFAIKDQGPGIAPEDIDRLFDKFYQAKGTKANNIPSSGLGLTLAKELSQLLGGKLQVASEKGDGATFMLSLKLTE